MARLRIGGFAAGDVPAASSSYKAVRLSDKRGSGPRVSVGTTSIGRTRVRVS